MKLPLCLTHVLCLGAVVFTLIPAQGTNSTQPGRPRRVELQRALVSFASWAKRYAAKSGTIAGPGAIEEGLKLAQQRRAALRELIQTDPAVALEAAIPAELRTLLPEAVAGELETPVYGTGDLLVACVMPTSDAQRFEPIQRFVRLDGRTYHAYVYGRRLGETTKFRIPLHGVALDGVLALDESVLYPLTLSEAAQNTGSIIDISKTVPAVPGNGPATLARLGQTVYRFASEEQLHRSEAMLDEAESDSPAEAVEPASELLEGGFVEKPFPAKGRHPLSGTNPNKKVLVVRVDFSDLPGDPRFPGLPPFTAASAQAIVDTQVSPFYQKSSYGRASMTFTVTPQLYRLPRAAADYAASYSIYDLHDDAMAAAGADYEKSAYDIELVLFSFLGTEPGSEIQFGGLTWLGTGMVWVNGEFRFRVVAHELGHTYGLNHAHLWKTTDGNPVSDAGFSVDYGDVFDTMGANWGNDGRVDFNPWFKSMLNWIDPSQVQDVTTNGLYRVYGFDNPAATGTLALRVVKDIDRNYWVGCRRNFADNPTMSHGAYVIWGYNDNQPSDLICAGQTLNDANLAALPLGGTLVDTNANLTISVVAEGGTPPAQYIDVQVTFGPPPAILAQPHSQELLEGQNAVFSVEATGDPATAYVWQRQAPGDPNWVTLVDGAGCSGANSPTLVINSATLSMSGSAFHCLLSNSSGGFNCSWTATLTVVPVLQISGVPGRIILSWPASASDFMLETRTDLSAAGAWTAVPGQPALVGRSFVVTNELQSPAAFYRLRSR